jgi:signal transduction histidine kinase
VDPILDIVEADERKVKQIVFNLLSNAVKFTPDGGQVHVTARLFDGGVQIAVRDSGIGIAPEDQARVFDEFRQVGLSTRQQEGTGLGLTLVRRFVELHGGRISLASEVGVGSTFTFTLPYALGATPIPRTRGAESLPAMSPGALPEDAATMRPALLGAADDPGA